MACGSRRMLHLLQATVTVAILLVALWALSLQGFAAGVDNTDVDIPDSRQQMVTVVVDGKNKPCLISGRVTVGEQLKKLEIMIEQMDSVTPLEDTVLKDGDIIKVSRRRIEQDIVEGEIPYTTVYNYSPNVIAGTEQVLVKGEEGYGTRTYEILVVDGTEESRTLVSEDLTKPPVTEEIGTGFRSELISPFDFEWTFDENGEPIRVKNVLRDQRSTAYSAKPGSKTASGRDAIVGHVAVNPNVIPYGSKLFIQSRDGKYIYGYAIAADTGIALMDGRSAIDIFYNTYQESCDHGVIFVDIFVLE